MGRIDNFTYASGYKNIDLGRAYVGRIPRGINNVKHVFQCLYTNLDFPGYFGFNWNALYDCLRDFHWIDKNEIVIIHYDLPMLSDEEIRAYLEILSDSVSDWEKDNTNHLKVVFPTNVKNIIEDIIFTNEI